MSVHHFKTNVLLKSIIGKDLINSDNIAILELVKNSFDAGSKKVVVDFQNVLANDDSSSVAHGPKASAVIVQDWGSGMDEDDIIHRWLNIAYSEKKQYRTAHGRTMAGAKGIGRFSCDRLGQFLDLYTRKNGGDIIHLEVDWRKFEIEGDRDKRIESVDVEVETLNEAKFAKTGLGRLTHGTILVIRKLRSQWNEEKLLSLRRYLERLINPNQSFSKTGFSLWLKAAEFSKTVNGEVENMIFTRLDFTSTSIETEISADGKQIATVLRDKGREIFKLIEHNRAFPLLKKVKIVIYYLNPYAKGYFKRMTGMDKVQFGSIFLFLNGFRIPPYGDEGDDWLGIDRRKQQGVAKNLGTRELVGRMEIDDESGAYRVVSSREGLVADASFAELTRRPDGFYFVAHRRLERYVVEGLDWDRAPDEQVKEVLQKAGGKSWRFDPEHEVYSESDKDKNLRVLEMLDSVISAKRDAIVSLTINPKLLDELAQVERERAETILSNFESLTPEFGKSTTNAIGHLRKEFEKQAKRLERAQAREATLTRKLKTSTSEKNLLTKENFFLRASATVDDRGISGLQHQIGISSDSIRRKIRELTRAISKGKTGEDLMHLVKAISLENGKIQAVSRYATRANFSMVERTTGTPKDVVSFIRQYSENVFIELPEHSMSGSRMEVTTTEGGTLQFDAKFSPLDLIVVIDNVLDNSRKAGASAIKMSFQKRTEKILEIRVRDNGRGVDPKYTDRIFDFGFTTTTGGSGIGLYHAKQIMSRIGSIEFVQPEAGGAEFVLTFKK